MDAAFMRLGQHSGWDDMNAAFTSYEGFAGPGSRGHGRMQEYM
jgi:hypothetical protein